MTDGFARAAVLGLVAGATFVFWLGSGRPLWLDEAFVAWVVQKPLADVVAAVAADSSPPLYYVVIKAWAACFGTSEVALRAFSLVALLLAGLLLRRLVRLLCPNSLTVLAVFLCLQPCLRNAQNARMYTFVLVPAVLAMHAFVLLLRGDARRRILIALALLTLCGLMTHYWFLFVVLAQGVATAIWCRAVFVRWALAVSTGAVMFVILWGGVAWRQLRSGATAWMLPPAFLDLPRTITDFGGGLWPTALAAGLLVAAAAFRRGDVTGSRAEILRATVDRRGGPFLVLLLAATLVPWALSFVQPLYFVGRYTVIAAVPLAVLVALLLREADRRVAWIAGLVFTGVSLAIAPLDSQLRSAGDDRASAGALLERSRPGDVVVFTSLSRAGLEYYLRRLRPEHGLKLASFPPALEQHPGWRDFSSVDDATVQAATTAMLNAIEGWRREGSQRVWIVHGFAPDEPFVGPLLALLARRHRTEFAMNVPGLFYNRIVALTL